MKSGWLFCHLRTKYGLIWTSSLDIHTKHGSDLAVCKHTAKFSHVISGELGTAIDDRLSSLSGMLVYHGWKRENLGRISSSEVVSGLPDSGVDHDCVPFSLTEEFVSLYRLHDLIPNNIAFFDAKTGQPRRLCQPKTSDLKRQGMSSKTVLISQIHSIPSVLTTLSPSRTNNYSQFMRDALIPADGVARDMATIDVLRDRE